MTVHSQNQATNLGGAGRRRPPATRRAERMANTRRALIDAGMELFARNGFDQTTTQDVAARAGVSSSTLFRYFPTKESILFVGEYDYTSVLCETVARQPADVSDIEAVITSMVELAPMMESVQDRVNAYETVVSSSPLLLGRERLHHLRNVELLAGAIAARHGRPVDPSTTLLADVATTVLGRAHQQWHAQPDRRLADIVTEHFAAITAAFASSNQQARENP